MKQQGWHSVLNLAAVILIFVAIFSGIGLLWGIAVSLYLVATIAAFGHGNRGWGAYYVFMMGLCALNFVLRI